MWIKKERIESMERRIAELEDVVARLECDTQLWIPIEKGRYSRTMNIGQFRGKDHVLLVDVIVLLLKKLGLQIKRQEPLPQPEPRPDTILEEISNEEIKKDGE